ncbi:MAG: MFS transporter [Acidilobaceae archaeon]
MRFSEIYREISPIALVLFINEVATATYFFSSRAFIRVLMGEDVYRYVILLISFESIANLFALLGGVLGDLYGRRIIALLSGLRALTYFSIPLAITYDLKLTFALFFVSKVFDGLFFSNALGTLLSRSKGSGRLYATSSTIFPIAWSIGSLVPGLLEPRGGYTLIFTFIGVATLFASLFLAVVGKESKRAKHEDLVKAFSMLPRTFLMGVIIAEAGLVLYWNLLSIKLYETTGSLLLFGLIGGTLTTMASVLVYPLAGIIVDKIHPSRFLGVVYIAYLTYGLMMYFFSGLLFAILWVLPLYPFKVVALTVTLSRTLPKTFQNTAAGITSLIYGLSGLIYSLFYFVDLDLFEVLSLYVFALTIGALAIIKASFRMLSPKAEETSY